MMMQKKIFQLFSVMLFLSNAAYAQEKGYYIDQTTENWTALHHINPNNQKTDFCMALSNDFVLGFKSNKEGVGLQIWDAEGQQIPNHEKSIALNIGKKHYIFNIKAMDHNTLMNRLDPSDFNILLKNLSYSSFVLVEYTKNAMKPIDLSGLPEILTLFHQCTINAGFTEWQKPNN